jgi:hypothetical protein
LLRGGLFARVEPDDGRAQHAHFDPGGKLDLDIALALLDQLTYQARLRQHLVARFELRLELFLLFLLRSVREEGQQNYRQKDDE